MVKTEPAHALPGMVCPLHRKDMSKVCHKCPLWVHVQGKDPQSKNTIDHWNCSLAWLPTLLIENAQMSRQTGAAVESFRNETIRQNDAAMHTMARGFEIINGEIGRAHREAVSTAVETMVTAQRALAITHKPEDGNEHRHDFQGD